MTETEYLGLLDALGAYCPVQPSEALESHHEVEIGDTIVCLLFDEEADTLALTIPLAPIDLGEDTPSDLTSLYRLVLQRQWQDGGDDGVYLGALPGAAELVGMVTLDAGPINGPEALLRELELALAAVDTAWYDIAAQWLIEHNAGHMPIARATTDDALMLRA